MFCQKYSNLNVEAESRQRRLQDFFVDIRSRPFFEFESNVKSKMIEDQSKAATTVIHVVNVVTKTSRIAIDDVK